MVFYAQEDGFPHQVVGHNIAVAFKPHGAVLENLSKDPVGSVKGLGWKEV